MVGETHIERVIAYLSRLMGEPVSLDQALALRSVQRAALASWARRESISLNTILFRSRGAVTVRELVGGDAKLGHDATPQPPEKPGAAYPSDDVCSLGVDIEDVDAIPVTDDYRDHPFFQDNFTAAEISYCVRQANVAESFCGTWAAKEAIVKSGLAMASAAGLKRIEIKRDARGRPIYPGCQLSISHTKRSAVAVCIRISLPPTAPPPAVVDPAPPSEHNSGRRSRVKTMIGVAACLIVAIAFVVARS